MVVNKIYFYYLKNLQYMFITISFKSLAYFNEQQKGMEK